MVLRASVIGAGLIQLSQGRSSDFLRYLRIATRRGKHFSEDLTAYITRHPHPQLIRLVERATRTNLLPGSEIATIRAAALLHVTGGQQVNRSVAQSLGRRPAAKHILTPLSQPLNATGRRFIVASHAGNPYFSMMYSKLHLVGFSMHYVSGFDGILRAVVEAQTRGERPHVHLDWWMTQEEATALIGAMNKSATLSITAHGLNQVNGTPGNTGMKLLVGRANAIHLLTQSSLQRLGIDETSIKGRSFHVPHPSYYGIFSGDYGFPKARTEARLESARPIGEFSVGLVGRISDRKNVDLLLQATEILQTANVNSDALHVYISGALHTRYAERIIRRASSLRNLTFITDDLDDQTAGAHVAALDVAVVPYHGYLNSGWTLLALSAGLPIIASRESTASEVVPREALIEFTEGDARSLAEAMAEAKRQNPELARLAALARASEVHPETIALRFAQEIAARVFDR